jgi:hypothetical protein
MKGSRFCVAMLLSLLSVSGAGADTVAVQPRATAGDMTEPRWEERLTVTVGPEKADPVGATAGSIELRNNKVDGVKTTLLDLRPTQSTRTEAK